MPLHRRGALGALALLAACRSPEPMLYTLLPVPGTPRRGGPRSVAVRDATVAGTLDRLPIVRSAESYRVEVAGNDWWGEPLDGMLTRILVENLVQRLPGSSVFGSGGAISAPAAAVVEVNLQRLGLTAPGTLLLTAQVAVSRREPRGAVATRTESVTVPVAGFDTRDFVAAASTAVGRLADAIAAMLAG
ncbi:PqiC family protein [Roseicella aquatilis]|uniref:Membrane integrity-associated transporter subunit PqiC n=1 Tax=Roseicella aquatilis TaxID=2527868 RepID=A0A4R4D9R2_9PROT|nr:PqiC family protein [Roseicella aquatilis]TCZ57216.1 membrane integrity-associated transporter subunit PqiC [Roseicella aquatilis]